ncbi:unnamed protein product, partial [Ectocarpus sp. 12 AP-2014]
RAVCCVHSPCRGDENSARVISRISEGVCRCASGGVGAIGLYLAYHDGNRISTDEPYGEFNKSHAFAEMAQWGGVGICYCSIRFQTSCTYHAGAQGCRGGAGGW